MTHVLPGLCLHICINAWIHMEMKMMVWIYCSMQTMGKLQQVIFRPWWSHLLWSVLHPLLSLQFLPFFLPLKRKHGHGGCGMAHRHVWTQAWKHMCCHVCHKGRGKVMRRAWQDLWKQWHLFNEKRRRTERTTDDRSKYRRGVNVRHFQFG